MSNLLKNNPTNQDPQPTQAISDLKTLNCIRLMVEESESYQISLDRDKVRILNFINRIGSQLA